jgi:hypothetical protein
MGLEIDDTNTNIRKEISRKDAKEQRKTRKKCAISLEDASNYIRRVLSYLAYCFLMPLCVFAGNLLSFFR